jgi:cell division protease FtsH
MAATNRKDVLDSALVRPGRFDRIIKLELPSTVGREKILRVHASKLPGFLEGQGIDDRRPGRYVIIKVKSVTVTVMLTLAVIVSSLGKGRAVDLSAVASATPGLSGAELEFIVNEAAIRAVRRVSSELRNGQDPATIVPTVEAIDFEESVKNFYETRRSKGGVGDLFRGLKG